MWSDPQSKRTLHLPVKGTVTVGQSPDWYAPLLMTHMVRWVSPPAPTAIMWVPPQIANILGVLDGEPHIVRNHIAVHDIVVWHEQMGMGVEEIVREYRLTPVEVGAALIYYHTHRAEIDEAIRAEEESERRWNQLFTGSADLLAEHAMRALAEYRAGQTDPLDPDAL